MTTLNTTTVQRALTVLAMETRDGRFSPGAVDGTWGPRTQRAWDVYSGGEVATPAPGGHEVEIPDAFAEDVVTVSRAYDDVVRDAPARRQTPARTTTTPTSTAPVRNNFGWVLTGIAAGIAVAGGLAWSLFRPRRRRS